MIYDTYSDNAAETLVELWGKIENELIEDIARRVKASSTASSTTEFELRKLEQSNLLNDRAVKLISENSGKSESEIERIINSIGLKSVEQDEVIYRAALESGQLTVEPLPLNMSPSMQKTIQSCVDNAKFGLSNLTNTRMIDAGNGMETLTKAARREYYNAANKAFLNVRTGTKSTQAATKEACITLAKKGITLTHWRSGHTDSVEVAVRRNIVTSMGQTAAELTLARMGDYQYDLVEVSAHWGARPSHYIWQGKVYSLTGSNGYDNFYDATDYGTGAGLCGWNCRHRFYPYFPGMSTVYPEYNEEENKKQYEDTQEQRSYERAVRAAKREKAVLTGSGASESEMQAANKNIRQAQKNLREFLAEHSNLTRDYSREQIYDSNGTVKGTK